MRTTIYSKLSHGHFEDQNQKHPKNSEMEGKGWKGRMMPRGVSDIDDSIGLAKPTTWQQACGMNRTSGDEGNNGKMEMDQQKEECGRDKTPTGGQDCIYYKNEEEEQKD